MNTRLVFVTGGARSGKSDFAVALAEDAAADSGCAPVYIATATAGDPEMAGRIEKHKTARGESWRTVEEPIEVARAVEGLGRGGGVVVLDCLTLWLTNLMMSDTDGFEAVAQEKLDTLIGALKGTGGTGGTGGLAVVVSNEVGMGIVPDNPLARRFRDAAGTANRMVAGAADEVYLVVSGIPVRLK